MPTLERLAKEGLRYNNFHTAPLCSPSRVALLTGRNPHSVNDGSLSELATAFSGQTSERPNSKAALPEIMKLNGYSTAMFGKSHEFTPWELSVSGPFDSWPIGSGFERFYGALSGEADLFAPPLMDNTTLVDLPNDPNYYYQTDLAVSFALGGEGGQQAAGREQIEGVGGFAPRSPARGKTSPFLIKVSGTGAV
jgi:arylsulfatase A-like enzyme